MDSYFCYMQLQGQRQKQTEENHHFVVNDINFFKDFEQDIYISGGASIYKAFLDYADKIYLTEIDDVCEEADTFFPNFDKSKYKKEIINSYTIFVFYFYS